MKKWKLSIVLLAGIVLFYTACKKGGSDLKPAPTTSNEQVASGQIAANLAQSLAGSYGGVNLGDGVNAPGFASQSSSFHSLNSFTSLSSTHGCGFFVDTNINFKTNIGDSIKSTTTGGISFHFKCDSTGKSAGYTTVDSLTTAGKAPGYTFTDIIVQNYDITALNKANTKIELDGTLKAWVDIDFNKKGSTPLSTHVRYKLDGVKIDLTTSPFDITDGTVTFVADGSSSAGSYHFTGTITFLGNHKAKIVINGFTFHVDLITGIVTAG
jgi:hypothetical protein